MVMCLHIYFLFIKTLATKNAEKPLSNPSPNMPRVPKNPNPAKKILKINSPLLEKTVKVKSEWIIYF